MADPFEALLAVPKAAEGYAQGKLENDPWNFAAKSIGNAQFQFDNPWAQLAANLAQGFGVGATSQLAKNNYNQNLGNAYEQMLKELPTSNKLEDPEMQNAMEPLRALYNVGINREEYANRKQIDEENRRLENEKKLFKWKKDQGGEGGGIKEVILRQAAAQYFSDMASPEARAARMYGLPFDSAAGQYLEKEGMLPSGWNQTPASAGVQPPAGAPVAEAANQPVPVVPPSDKLSQAERYKQALVASFGDPKAAAARIEKEDKDNALIAADMESMQDHKRMVEDLGKAIFAAKDTGGAVAPEWTQAIRESWLKLKSNQGNKEAEKRIMAMQDLTSMALEAVAQIRRDFPGSVTEKEMEIYAEAAASAKKTPEQNLAIYQRLVELQNRVERQVRKEHALMKSGYSFANAKLESLSTSPYQEAPKRGYIRTDDGAWYNPATQSFIKDVAPQVTQFEPPAEGFVPTDDGHWYNPITRKFRRG